MKLPLVPKPSFTVSRRDREGIEERTFDALSTAAYLSKWKVDEYTAYFFGWKYEQVESSGIWWHRWISPKGKGVQKLLGVDITPPRYRSSKWGEVLAYCTEAGWEPSLVPSKDGDGWGCKLAGLDNWVVADTKGEAICRSFLHKAWLLQDAEEATNA